MSNVDIVLSVTSLDVPQVRVQQAGIAGPAGTNGSAGGARYVHVQSAAATVWTIQHNMNAYPSVVASQLKGLDDWEVIEGDIVYTDANTITITFGSQVSGRAFVT